MGLLTGLIFDDRGNAMSPSKSRKPNGTCYLYYVSQAYIQRRDLDAMRPVPAPAIEEIVRDRIGCIIGIGERAGFPESQNTPLDATGTSCLRDLIRQLVMRIEVAGDRIAITFNAHAIASHTGISSKQSSKGLRARLPSGDKFETDSGHIVLTVPVRLRLRGGIKRVEGWDQSNWTAAKPRHDAAFIKALARAHEWREWIEMGKVLTLEDLAAKTGHHRSYLRQTLKLAFLSPDIQRAILTGRQPKSLTLAAFGETDLPLIWADQRTLLGFA